MPRAEQRNNAQVPHGRRSRRPPGANSTATRCAKRSAGARAEPQHPERLEPRRAHGLRRRCPKKLTWSELRVNGPARVATKLAAPPARENFYRDLFVLAYRVNPELPKNRRPLQNLVEKACSARCVRHPHRSARRCSRNFPPRRARRMRAPSTSSISPRSSRRRANCSGRHRRASGRCCVSVATLNDHCRVSTCSEGWAGYAIDPFDPGAFRRYWDAVV